MKSGALNNFWIVFGPTLCWRTLDTWGCDCCQLLRVEAFHWCCTFTVRTFRQGLRVIVGIGGV